MRKAELIALLMNSLGPTRSTWEPLRDRELDVAGAKPYRLDEPASTHTSRVQVIDTYPIAGPSHQAQPSKNKSKRDARSRTKTIKESERLRSEIDKLTSKRDELKNKANKLAKGPHVGFKKRRIRLTNKEIKRIEERIQELTNKLKKVATKLEIAQRSKPVSKENKALRRKIEDLNRKN